MHNSDKRRGVAVVTVLAVLCVAACFSASIEDVCVALKAVSLPPSSQQHYLTPDALEGIKISSSQDLAWVSPKGCSAGSKTYSGKSDWNTTAEVCVTKAVGDSPKCSNSQTRSVVEATLDTDKQTFTVSAKIEFQFTLSVGGSAAVPMTGQVGFDMKDVPVSLLGRAVPVWTGSMSGSATGVTIVDSDLFDGVAARVFDASESGTPSAETVATIQRVAELATNVAGRVKFFEMVPSALSGDLTARMAFPNSLALMKVDAKDVKMLGTDLAYANATATCQDEGCGHAVARVMKNFAESEGKCVNATMVHAFGTLSAIITAKISSRKHNVTSSRAWVQGAVHCENNGFMLITLEALSDADDNSNEYDSKAFMEDDHAAAQMTKAVAMTLSGSRVAVVGSGSSVYTTMEGDLFGNGRGGVFVEDVAITKDTKTQFVNAVKDFADSLKTGRSALDVKLASMLNAASPETVFNNYFDRTATPTGHGLWQYWAHQINGIDIMMGENRDSLVANVDMTLRGADLPYSSNKDIYSAMNTVLETLHKELDGASHNKTAPELTDKTYPVQIMDGAVSASINIPKLNASFRLRAESDVDSWAIATVNAEFADKCTLKSAHISLVLGKTVTEFTPAVDYAVVYDGRVIARSSSNVLIEDEAWKDSELKAVAKSLGAVLDQVQGNLSSSVEQLRLVTEGSTVTYADILNNIIDVLNNMKVTNGTAKAVSVVMKEIQDSLKELVDKLNNKPFIGHFAVTPVNKDKHIEFAFDVFAIRHISSDAQSDEWKRTIPLPRLHVQTPTTTNLYFQGSNGRDGILSTFTQKGQSTVAGWSLPVRSGMRCGIVTGTASLSIDFPVSSKLVIDLSGKMERGETVNGHFEGNMTVHMDDPSQLPSNFFTWTFTEENRGDYAQTVAPEDAVHNFFDNSMIMDTVAGHRLASPVAPFSQPLSSFFDTSNLWDNDRAFFYTDEANPVLAAAVVNSTKISVDEIYNFSVNRETFADCDMVFTDLSTANAEELFTKFVQECPGLSNYVKVQYIPNSENSNDDDNEGRVVFVPTCPGLVYSFKVVVDANTSAPLKSQSWSAGRTMPDALSWNDFYDSVYSTFFRDNGIEYTLPTIEKVPISQLQLVDKSREEFYPSSIDAMFFPVSFSLQTQADSVPVTTSIESDNLQSHFEVDGDNFSVPVTVSGEVSTTYGYAFWCSLGDGSLNMSTSFDSTNHSFDTVVVPDSPNNTFTITFTYETRDKTNVDARPPVTVHTQTIALTPKHYLGNELLENVVKQITDAKIQKMLVIDNVTDPLREPVLTQVSMMFMPHVNEGGNTIDVPLSISLDASTIPYWGNNETAISVQTMTTCPINKDFTTSFRVRTSPASLEDGQALCTGVTGVIAANATATLNSEQNFTASAKKSYEFQAHLISSAVDDVLFDKFFDSVADIKTTFDFSDFKFAVDHVASGDLEKQVLRFLIDAQSISFKNLTNLTDSKYITDVISESASAMVLKTLSTSTRDHLCEALKLADNASQAFSSDPANQESLPLVDSSVGPLFEQRLGSILSTVTDTICTDQGELTLDPLCQTLSKSWGVQACADVSLDERSLMIYVSAAPPSFKVDAGFKFDVNKLIPLAKKNYTAGVGADGDFVLVANTTASFGVRLDFVNESIDDTDGALTKGWGIKVSLDPAHTKFHAGANIDANSQVKASFGSIQLNFASANVHLDAHIDAAWTEEKKVNLDFNGTASLKAGVSLEPIFSCNIEAGIPSLADFIYNRGGAVWNEHCGMGVSFLDALDSLVDEMTLAHYFEQDPSLFWKQFSKDLDAIFDQLIQQILNRAVTFIGKQLQGLIHKALDKITGPEAAEAVSKEIAEMVAHIILNHTAPTPEELEKIVLIVFTGILNKQFGPYLREPIPTPMPNPPDGRYVWAFRFGHTTTKPLTNIDFHLGGHGLAQFGVKCHPNLVLKWDVDFDMVWTKGKGISIEWSQSPAIKGDVGIVNQGECEMEGRLLFMAAIMTVNLQCDVVLQVLANDNKKLSVLEFYTNSSITGEAQIGLVGILKNKTDDSIKNSLPALPHVKSGINIVWGLIDLRSDHQGHTTPFKFEFKEPKLCLGTLITGFLKRVTDQIYKVIHPLEPVFGKNGILLKKIDALKPFLNDHNDLLGIIELMCKYYHDSCNVNAVRKLCETIREVSEVMEMLNTFHDWLSGDPEGCASFSLIYKTFHVNWTKPNPEPEPPTDLVLRDWDDEGHFDFGDNLTEKQKAELQKACTGWKKGGEFKFTLDILQKFPTKLIEILLGQNIPLFSLSFPYATFSFTVSWAIPVWAFPYIEIVVDAHAALEFRPPPIALLSGAVVDTIRTHDPSHIFRNLAIKSLDGGQPFYFINGYIEIGGGVAVGVSIFVISITGEATIYIRFSAGIAVASINNQEWSTFAGLALQVRQQGWRGAVDIELKFTGGFRIALKGCVHVLFGKHCWTFASKSWSKDFGSWSFKPKLLPEVCDAGGTVNGDTANLDIAPYDPPIDGNSVDPNDGVARFTITPSNVMLLTRRQTDADAPLHHDLSSNPNVHFTGNVCEGQISVTVVGDVNFPILLPDCDKALLNVSQTNYESSGSSFAMTQNTISASDRPAITFSGNWNQVVLSEPDFCTSYDVSGKPSCDVTIETLGMSKLTLSGNPSAYGSKPIVVTGGLQDTISTVLCSNFYIDMDKFNCTCKSAANVVDVRTPAEMLTFTAVASNPEESVFHIIGVPDERSVSLTSATSYTNFSVPDLSAVNGYTEVIGNSAGQMYLLTTMRTTKNAPANIRMSLSSVEFDNGDNSSHVIHHTNVPFREFDIYGAENQLTNAVLMPPTEFDVVTIRSHGVQGSNMTHSVTGCHVRSGVEIHLDGAGSQTIVFGDRQGLKTSACTASIVSNSKNVDSAIVVNAQNEERQLRWDFRSGKFTVSSVDAQSDTFQVLYDGVKSVTVNFANISTDVTINSDQGETDFVLNFPETNGAAVNKLNIIGTPASVLVNGPVKIIKVGAQGNSVTKTPFANINGVIAVSRDTVISLDSSKMQKALGHSYKMDSLCLVDEVAVSGKKIQMSDWFIQQVKDSGMTVPAQGTPCSLLYNSNAKQSLDIRTSNGADNFTADGAAIPVSLDLGGNADNVKLKNTNGVKFSVNLGVGADTLEVLSTGDVDADLGVDQSTDIVRVHYIGQSPNIDGNIIYPVGKNDAKLVIHNWLQQDMISVVRDGDKRSVNNRFRAGFGSQPVIINNNNSGTTLLYEEASDTTYHIVGCADNAVIALDVHSSVSPSLAENAIAYVLLNDVSTACEVRINSDLTANGTAGILVPKDMKHMPSQISLQRDANPIGTGKCTFGLLLMRPTNISHFELAIPPNPSLSEEGVIDVNDVPSGADLLISAPGTEWNVNLVSLFNNAVILDAMTNISKEILHNKNTVILAGNSHSSVVNVDGSKTKQVDYISGCLVTEEGPWGRSLSDWIIWRTLDQYNVSIGTIHTCSIETMNADSVYISGAGQVGIGGLTSKSATKVTVLGAKDVNLTIDPDVKDSNLVKTYGIWSTVSYSGFENGTNHFAAKRTNGETFDIYVLHAKKLTINRGKTMFQAGSQLKIDCVNSSANTNIILNKKYADEVQMRETLTVSSDKCNAVINNMISTNASIAPSVTLGHGLKLNLDMAVLDAYVPNNDASNKDDNNMPVRTLKIHVNTTTNRTTYSLKETPAGKGSKPVTLAHVEWDSEYTQNIAHDLRDVARYVLDFDSHIIDSKFVRMNVSSASMLNFEDLHGSTVLFVAAKPTDFKPDKRRFSLSPSTRSGDYCFDPCQDCTEGAWGRVVISGKICQPRDAQDSCKKRAKVTVNVTGKLESVSCGPASFDNSSLPNGTCSFAMNVNGGTSGVLTVPDNIMLGTTIVITASIVLTVIGASSLTARLVFACKHYSNINIWWTRNSFRDLLTDQFSWAAIVMTACLPEVSDVDYSQWGGWVVAIMMRAKLFVLNWFVSCSDDGEPVWVTPATIVFWSVTLITVVLRIIELILNKRDIALNGTVKNAMLGIQSILAVAGFLLMPLVGYSLAFLNESSYEGYASLLCMVLLFLSQPVGEFSRACITGVIVSVVNVLLPVAMCIYVGVGADFLPLIIMALAFTVILPVIDSIVLWFSFFRKSSLRNAAWKHSIGWTTSLRIVSTLCGLAFLILLFFKLSDKTSKIAAILWFVWVCAPFLSIIPLTVGVPAVLTSCEVVPTRKPLMSEVNDVIDESSPLLGTVQPDGSGDEL